MKKLALKLSLLSALLLTPAILPAATVIEEEKVQYEVAPSQPPVEKEEVITTRPGPNYTWIPGRWRWENKWNWSTGHWFANPHPNAVWVPGHWVSKPHGWVWIRGHWE
jgi:hypothetical protein